MVVGETKVGRSYGYINVGASPRESGATRVQHQASEALRKCIINESITTRGVIPHNIILFEGENKPKVLSIRVLTSGPTGTHSYN